MGTLRGHPWGRLVGAALLMAVSMAIGAALNPPAPEQVAAVGEPVQPDR